MTSKSWQLGGHAVGQMQTEAVALPIWQLRALRRGLLRSCLNCDQFNETAETCAVAGEKRPPALVIVLGCDSWVEDIPF